MRQASVFVLTSDWEGLPNALIEAQGLGVPAVSTRCPFGPEEIIRDGITGWLVDSDASQLGQKILSVLRDRPRRMGQLARERAREMFASENIVPRWQTLLTEPG